MAGWTSAVQLKKKSENILRSIVIPGRDEFRLLSGHKTIPKRRPEPFHPATQFKSQIDASSYLWT
jgi:hypothetical protein